MCGADLEKYCAILIQNGATHACVIDPGSVVTAPWVRMKCLFGCPNVHRSYCCPPDSPTPEQTRSVLDSYRRAILVHYERPQIGGKRGKLSPLMEKLIDLEGELFKDGYYKAFAIVAGPCSLCRECGKTQAVPCRLPARARPSMEACGIDVFQTARNNGFPIKTLQERTETQNNYCLLLAD